MFEVGRMPASVSVSSKVLQKSPPKKNSRCITAAGVQNERKIYSTTGIPGSNNAYSKRMHARRFMARPSRVSLVAIGSLSPLLSQRI